MQVLWAHLGWRSLAHKGTCFGPEGRGVEKCDSAPQNAKDICRRLHVAGGAQDPMESIDASVTDLGDASHGSGNVDASNVGSVGVSASSHKRELFSTCA